MPVEPLLGAIEVILADGQPSTVTADEASHATFAEAAAQDVADQGTDDRAKGGGEDDRRQPEPTLSSEEAGKGEDGLGRDWGKGILEGDEDGNPT